MTNYKAVLSALLAVLALPVAAQSDVPGANFISQWDGDGNGSVSQVEVLERRGDIYAAYDVDENGSLDASELADMDNAGNSMRAAMQEDRAGNASPNGQGKGHGNGQGKGSGTRQGNGQGNRIGQGNGNGPNGNAAQDSHALFDTDHDGLVTEAEFIAGSEAWFAQRDRNGDGQIDSADFGPRR